MAKFFYLGLCGSENPTRAGLPFHLALGALEAGHQAEISLAGDAVVLMKNVVMESVLPVALPSLKEMFDKVVQQRVPIYV